MLGKIIYALPELSLLLGIINLFLLYLLANDSPKAYARSTRFWLLVSLLCSIIFYDKSFSPLYFADNSYTLLFALCSNGCAYIMLSLVPAWFSAENKTGCKYYILILASLAGMNFLISSINLIALLFSYVLLIFINYRLLGISYEKLPSEAASRYMGISAVIIVLFATGFCFINITSAAGWDYPSLQLMLKENNQSLPLFMASVLLIVPFLYSLSIAPFHFMAEEKVGKAILPVAHYFALVAPFAFWGAFIKLNAVLWPAYGETLKEVYKILALLSAAFGAIGANARINLHRIYAFGTLCYFGLILLVLAQGSPDGLFLAFVCLFLYMLGLSGIYLVFYGLKSHGEYLSAVTSLSGLAETKPYTTAALLISLFSLVGFPPLAGFLGQFNLFFCLINNGWYVSLGIMLCCLLVLSGAYLEILKTAYFEHKVKIYDKESKLILFYILANIAAIAFISFNPLHILEILKEMFSAVFI